jgi:UDP-glucose 4-epimerase
VAKQYALVTGAAGFIGARLTEKLIENGRNVIALDCFLPDLYSAEVKRGRWERLTCKEDQQLIKIEFDLRKDDFARLGSFEINSVFNEAAMPGLIQDWGKFQPYYDCNISALNRLLEFVRTKSIASFVHASTSSVYGKNAVGKENQELRPTSPYGVSKLAAEKLLLAYLEWHSTPVRILRYFSVYGPNQRPDMAYAKIIENLKQGNEFVIHGDGEQRRSNTFIDDIIEATLLSENKAKPGDVMNICGDETVSLNQAISIIENSADKSLKKRYVEARIGDQRETSGSNNFAKERLGWVAKVGIEEGLELQVKAALED